MSYGRAIYVWRSVVRTRFNSSHRVALSERFDSSSTNPISDESEKKNVDPAPGWDSTQIFPRCRSTIFLVIASPIPEPEYSSTEWRRSKM
jgi:hypothetical protein